MVWMWMALSAALLLSGCTSCNVDHTARAQGLDAGVRPGPDTTATCFVQGQRSTALLQTQVNELCVGAPTPTGPVDCYVAATSHLILTDPQKIGLCHCARSTEPVDCYLRLQRESMLITSQIETICSPTINLGLLPNCRPIGGGGLAYY